MRAVVVPAAPALLPGIGGAADPLADLRDRARALAAETITTTKGSPSVVVVGAGPTTRQWSSEAPSGAARFTTGRVPEGALPTALEIGRGFAPFGGGELVLQSVATEASPAQCTTVGDELATDDATVLVVVADGPATLTEKAPGHLQPEATPFAEGLRRALATGDTEVLGDLDPATCERLWMRGRPALQVLAGAFDGWPVRGELFGEESPFGVQYLLARWT